MADSNTPRAEALAALGLRQEPHALTEVLVRKVLMTPVSRRYTVADRSLQGFFLVAGAARPGNKGKPVPGPVRYWVQAKVAGRVRQVRLGPAEVLPLAEARQQARAMLVRLHRGEDPVAEKRAAASAERARVSVRTYVEGDWWKKHARNRKSGSAEKKRLLAAWVEILDLKMDELTPENINAVLQARRDAKLAAGTLIRDWTALRSLLGQAKEDGLLSALPFDRRRPPALAGLQGTKRVRWLGQHDPKELEKFEKALAEESADVQAALKLLALTGMRRGELLGLRKQEVNKREGVVLIPPERSKSGKERRIYLNAEAKKVIDGLKVIDTSGRYFPPTKKGSLDTWKQRLKKAMRRIREAVGTDDLTLHDLRHHFAVRARQAGAPLEVVRDLLGHADMKSTQIYAHVGPTELKDAVSRVKL
jgi:integrase